MILVPGTMATDEITFNISKKLIVFHLHGKRSSALIISVLIYQLKSMIKRRQATKVLMKTIFLRKVNGPEISFCRRQIWTYTQ